MFAIRLFLALAVSVMLAQAGSVNVALNMPVTVGGGGVSGAALATLTDGIFLGEGTGWTTGTIWWHGTAPYLVIDLGALYWIDEAIVQGDNNDSYSLDYAASTSGAWTQLWAIGTYGGGGMRTRPNANHVTRQPVGPVQAGALRIRATGGDNSYSVSEVQVFANPAQVPEPAGVALVLGGLASLALSRKRSAGLS